MNKIEFCKENICRKIKNFQPIHRDVLNAFIDSGKEQIKIPGSVQCLLSTEILDSLKQSSPPIDDDVYTVCVQDLLSAGFLCIVRDSPDKEICYAVTNLGFECTNYWN